MYLFDSHCHLQDARIFSRIDSILERARCAGVSKIVCCGCHEDDWEQVAEIAKRYPGVLPSFGLHPWYVSRRSDTWLSLLQKMLTEMPEAAIGEIGLDHALTQRNDREQESIFIDQLRLAALLKRPVSIHCRRAWGNLLKILQCGPGIPCGGVIHSYSGPPDLVKIFERAGLNLSFSGSVTYERNKRAQRSVQIVSEEHLLLETDSPDIIPDGICGFNEPSHLTIIAQKVSQLRDCSLERIAESTYNNGMNIFGNMEKKAQ